MYRLLYLCSRRQGLCAIPKPAINPLIVCVACLVLLRVRVCASQGDLKAGNVLLQHSIHGAYGQIAKISDFGLSAVLMNDTTHRSTASLGTITHAAPE